MSRFLIFAFVLTAFVLSCTAVCAQEPAGNTPVVQSGKTFRLLRDDANAQADLDLTEEQVEAWDPALKDRAVQISLGIGFMSIGSPLLQHDQIIYKYNTDATSWGDIEIQGESAFAPTLRMGWSLTDWFVLEGWGGVSISEYTTTITNTHRRKNEPGSPVVDNPELLEFDAEHRSLITLQAGVNAVWYPLDMSGAGGRWHPYLTGGVGNMWYSMNSNYTEDTASALDTNFGGGIRLLADRNVSVRIEVLMHRNTLEWTPAEYFTKLDEGTTLVPLTEYPTVDGAAFDERRVTSFESNTMSMLHWMIGVQGSF